MNNQNKLVSIGMPVFNGEKYIREAIDSVMAQTFTEFELIISDNGSTDKTEKICREYAKNDLRIRYIRQPKNRGINFNSNFVLQKARGLYFTWLAHDDILEKQFLKETDSYLSLHNDCFIVTGDFESIDEFGKKIRTEKLISIRDNIKWEYRCREFFKYPIENVYFCIYGLLRTEKAKIIVRNTPHPKMLTGSELPFLARFAAAGQIVSIPMVLRKYRRHSQSLYCTEVSNIKSKPVFVENYIYFTNLYRLRFDQMKVIIGSNYPITLKITIITSVHFGYLKSFLKYLKSFLGRIIHLPKKLFLLIKSN